MRLWSWIAVLSLTVISLLLDPALTRAQVVDRPAELRRGICASPGDLVATLAHLVLTTGEMQGQTGATPVEQSGTVVQYTIADVLSADYIVLVRRSPAEEEIVACAEVGGAINPDGTLAVGMVGMNGSGLSGVTYFTPIEQFENMLITILLVGEYGAGSGEVVSGGGTTSESAAGGDYMVDMPTERWER
jgi:hypothetical protein